MIRCMTLIALWASMTSAFAGPSEQEAAKRVLRSDDDRLYCHAGGRWGENAIRCLSSGVHQRCLPAEINSSGSSMRVDPAKWIDVKSPGPC